MPASRRSSFSATATATATATAAAALFAGLVLTTPAQAIVTDTGGLPALPAGLDLSGVGRLSNGCSSVLLAGGQYVLASGHCAAQAGGSVSFLGGTVSAAITATVFAPGFDGVALNDLSISRLAAPVTGIAGYAWATGISLPTPVVLAGYGFSGSGATGASGTAGALRFGFNDYEQLLEDDPATDPPAIYGGTIVGFDFDDGSAALNRFGSLGGPGEAGLAPLDSGGPSFAFIAGGWQIVGIHSAVDDRYGLGFGGIGYDVLVSRYAGWIGDVAAVPEPGTAALLALGLALLAGRVRAQRRSVPG